MLCQICFEKTEIQSSDHKKVNSPRLKLTFHSMLPGENIVENILQIDRYIKYIYISMSCGSKTEWPSFTVDKKGKWLYTVNTLSQAQLAVYLHTAMFTFVQLVANNKRTHWTQLWRHMEAVYLSIKLNRLLMCSFITCSFKADVVV